jgi:predicted dehydrogenase
MKVGVVGFGYWGPHLVRNFKSLLEIDDVVVCDQSKGRVQAARNLYPGISTFFDFSEMLGTAKLDAVAIATPSHTHYELVKQALRSGLHVLVEKPITTDSKEAAELDEIARENGLVLMVDHTFLYSDSVTFMKKAIDDGRIERVRSIDSVRVNLGIFQPDVSVAWDLAIHDLAIIFSMFFSPFDH